MKKVSIKIYQKRDATHDQRKLIETLIVNVESDKSLNASRASKILKRELPRFICADTVMVKKTDEGWETHRTIEPNEKCSFHYLWEYAVISEWSS